MEGIKKNPSASILTYVKKDSDSKAINEKKGQDRSKIAPRDQRDQGDQVQFSSESKDIREATRQLKDMPDIRPRKVAELKDMVTNGKYLVNSKKLAYQMILENMWD